MESKKAVIKELLFLFWSHYEPIFKAIPSVKCIYFIGRNL